MAIMDTGINISGLGVDSDSPVNDEGLYVDLILWPVNRVALKRAQYTPGGTVSEMATVSLTGPTGAFVAKRLDADRPALDVLEVDSSLDGRATATGHGVYTPKGGTPEECPWQLDLWHRDDTGGAWFATIILWTEEPHIIWLGKSPEYSARPRTIASITAWHKGAAA